MSEALAKLVPLDWWCGSHRGADKLGFSTRLRMRECCSRPLPFRQRPNRNLS
jgi:hypothetical protein